MPEIQERRSLAPLPENLKLHNYAAAQRASLPQTASPVAHKENDTMESLNQRFHAAFGANAGNLTAEQQAAYWAALNRADPATPAAPEPRTSTLADATRRLSIARYGAYMDANGIRVVVAGGAQPDAQPPAQANGPVGAVQRMLARRAAGR
jgi:hypothetical protein